MDNSSQEFLGVGWKFPIEFKTSNYGVSMLNGEELIKNSLDVLFATNLGDRIMQPDYGSELDHFLFENMSKSIITYMEARISDASAPATVGATRRGLREKRSAIMPAIDRRARNRESERKGAIGTR